MLFASRYSLSAVVLNAQQVVTLTSPGGVVRTNFVTLESKTVTGAPYAAETVNDNTQTLADGNRIVQHSTGRVYRDSEGRVRREEETDTRVAGQPGASRSSIRWPASRTRSIP